MRGASERKLDLIGLGECMIELSASVPLRDASTLNVGFGGDVMNTLMMASRLGRRTGFISRIGDDAFGPGLRERWEAAGIDVSACPLVPGYNGMYIISTLKDNAHEFWYYRTGSAASSLSEDAVSPGYIASARAIILSGITQAISESAQRATLRAAKLAREAGTMVFYDPNVRLKLWAERSGGTAPQLAQAAVAELLPFVDCVLPSHPSDAVAIGSNVNQLDDAAHASRYVGMGIRLVGMKLGSDGSCVYTADERVASHPVAAPSVVDSTGAGDAWNAAFICSLLNGQSAAIAGRLANKVAAWKVAHQGAIPPDTAGLTFESGTVA